MFDHHITNKFIAALSNVQFGSIEVTTPDGKKHAFSGNLPGAAADLLIYDWRMVFALVKSGDTGLAETYRDGWWDSSHPTNLFLFGLQNEPVLKNYLYGNVFGRIASRVAYLFSRNTIKGSQKNIHSHYDLGNDFYSLWLDSTMTYSAAIFSDGKHNLKEAQLNKYDRIVDRIDSSGSLLEIGCGWGGFAERALQKGDYGIKALTISQEQHDFARKRLGKGAVIAMEDYRHQKGQYDQIVSIEMFEAVGEQFWPVYFSKLKSLLGQKGKAVIQTITIGDHAFEKYRASGDAIRTFIFPGGMLPSPSRFREESARAGFRVSDEFAFGQDYAETLRHWLQNFETRISEVRGMGFDEKFIRMWRFYLTCCIAAFSHGRTDVMQWELRHAS